MTVKELIDKLKEFPEDMEVFITDGFNVRCYHTRGMEFQIWDDDFFGECLDIGIGGLDYNDLVESLEEKIKALSNKEYLLELAKKNPPPKEWYEEDWEW